jgi:Recombination endonuclease VII
VALVASAAAAGFCARSCPRRRLAQFTGARHVCSHLDQLRKRSAEDPDYRQKRLAHARTYQQAHKEKINAYRRRKWHDDPAYRERRRASGQAYRDAHREEIRERARLKWQTNPEYRARRLADSKSRTAQDNKHRRKQWLRSVYGISIEEYDAMLARQGGVCAICKKKPDKGKPLCVDHCHLTGQVRGLLCHKCNSVLAFGNDDPDILSAAIAYLQAACDRDRNVTRRHTASASGRGKLAVGRKSLRVRPNPKLPTAAVI